MLGVGIDYAIQMHAPVEEEVVIDREAHPIQETAQPVPGAAGGHLRRHLRLRRPALRQGADDPRLRPAAAVGIAAICLCSIIAPLAALGIREYKSPTKGKDFREGFLGRLTVKLGSLPGRSPPMFIVPAC